MLETTWSRKGGEGGKLPVDNSYKGRFPSGTREGAARCTRCTRCTSTREGAASPCCKKLRCLLCPAQGGRFWRPCLDHVVNPPLATCCPAFPLGGPDARDHFAGAVVQSGDAHVFFTWTTVGLLHKIDFAAGGMKTKSNRDY